MVRDSWSSIAAITAFAIAYGGTGGVKNLLSQDDGRLIFENIGVNVYPGRTSVVLTFGALYLDAQ